MGKPNLFKPQTKKIVDAQGQDIPESRQPSQEEIDAIKEEIGRMLEDDNIKALIAALVAGHQLYSWAHYKLYKMETYSDNARQSLYLSVLSSQLDDKGSPRSFSQDAMFEVLITEVMPFVKKEIDAATAAAKQAPKAVSAPNPETPEKQAPKAVSAPNPETPEKEDE